MERKTDYNKADPIFLAGTSLEGFIFAMFNKNQKQGGTGEEEKHFGLFYPNMQPVYIFS